jgi:hypothetical protein
MVGVGEVDMVFTFFAMNSATSVCRSLLNENPQD